jgi:Mg2+ and Co2+ transporter CorA
VPLSRVGGSRTLLPGIEELENKRKAISVEIDLEQQKKTDVQTQLRELTEKLSRINDSLGRKVSARNEYDTTIQETEAAYLKVPPYPPPSPVNIQGSTSHRSLPHCATARLQILESSQTLDHVMKRQGK